MAKMTNTFNQGMDQDSSKNKYDNKHYYAAENARIFSQDGLSGGALEDFKGTLERLDIDGKTPVGYCILRDDIILFITDNSTDTPSGSTYDYIVRVPIEELEALTTNQVYPVDFVNYHVTPADGYNLIYTEQLSFCKSNPIKAIPRYENEHVQKVYWVDGYNNLRWLNVVYNADTNDLINLPLDHLEVIGDFDMTTPEVTDVISGELRAGKIQYAYQLYMLNGSQTIFSPTSPLFHVTEPSDTEPNSVDYFGSDLDDATGKGFRGTISITAGQYYSRCRVIAIQYFTYSDEPEIRIISETDVSGSYVNFTDTGQTLGSITLEELRILSTSLFSAFDLETKDNILFPANITEDAFDVDYDARAYRFTGIGGLWNAGNPDHNYTSASQGIARIYDEGVGSWDANVGLYYQTIDATTKAYSGGGDWEDVPEDHDCINAYNNIVLENNPFGGGSFPWSYRYRYQTDGSTCGGEGPNVKYEFATRSIIVGHDDATPAYPDIYNLYTDLYGISDDFSYDGFESPYRAAYYAGYQHDEIYRFGIVFFDAKGRSSFVKWIGDIRFPTVSFPDYNDWDQYLARTDGSDITAQVPYIKFTISNMPSDAVSYQIVRVKRESTDRSILAQGMVNQPDDGDAVNTVCFDRWRNTGDNTEEIFQFHSPEVAFNKNLSLRESTDFVQQLGIAQALRTFSPAGAPSPSDVMDLTLYTGWNGYSPADEVAGVRVTNMNDAKIVTQQEVQVNIGTISYIVLSGDAVDTDLRAQKGINFVFQLDGTAWDPRGNSYINYALINYKRDIFESQYGGITYQARKNSEYIVAGELDSTSVYGGDTYIGMFDCLYSSHAQGYGVFGGGLRTDAVYFPCETSFNLPLRGDDCYSRVHEKTDAGLIHDTAGVWDNGAVRFYFQERDLYIYNSVYSRPNDTKLFVDTPFDWRALTTFDSRILASLTKTNGESRDSWLIYPANQFIDVDPQYGPIKAVKLVNNRLLYFQDTAFGVVSVNERALIETGNVSQLSLGVAGLLDRYDYAKTDVGCYHWRQLTLTSNALYWVDLKGKAMYKYGKGPEEVSLMKGMDTWFRATIPDEDIADKKSHYKIDDGMHLFYDPEYKEVYFVVDDNDTIVYNEVTDSFVTFSSMNPHFTVNYLDKVLGIQVGDNSFLRHNDFYAERGHLYGIQRQLSVTLLLNPDPDDIAIFNNFEWLTEATLNDIDQPETWYSIQAYNDYQDTGAIILVPGDNVKRRMRKWRYTIPRGVRDKNGVLLTDDQRYARMRDSHMFARFAYVNVGSVPGKKFIVHDIITSFTISNK